MNILIIEDEGPAAKRLIKLIQKIRADIKVLDIIDSVDAAVKWLKTFPKPDLIFMDIQLADGVSFDIFNETTITSPVIFTTAYDQYTLKAFKVNSLDYLLKPIDEEELAKSFEQFNLYQNSSKGIDQSAVQSLLQTLNKTEYKERFLVKSGQQLSYITTESINYFFSEDGFVHLQSRNGRKHIIDYTLDQLETMLDPGYFFRINRKFIVHLSAIQKIHTYFNSRLKVELTPKFNEDVIVSRDRVGAFKKWLDK